MLASDDGTVSHAVPAVAPANPELARSSVAKARVSPATARRIDAIQNALIKSQSDLAAGVGLNQRKVLAVERVALWSEASMGCHP